MTAVGARAPEASLATKAAFACLLVGAPVVAAAGWLHGAGGASGALAGTGMAMTAFAGAGLMTAWAGRFGTTVLASIVVGGVMLRLALYLVILDLLAGAEVLHRPSLAIATACATAATLVYEIRAAGTDPRYFWVQTPRGAAR